MARYVPHGAPQARKNFGVALCTRKSPNTVVRHAFIHHQHRRRMRCPGAEPHAGEWSGTVTQGPKRSTRPSIADTASSLLPLSRLCANARTHYSRRCFRCRRRCLIKLRFQQEATRERSEQKLQRSTSTGGIELDSMAKACYNFLKRISLKEKTR